MAALSLVRIDSFFTITLGSRCSAGLLVSRRTSFLSLTELDVQPISSLLCVRLRGFLMLHFKDTFVALVIWGVVFCITADPSWGDTTILSDAFSNSGPDPGNPPDSTIWGQRV